MNFLFANLKDRDFLVQRISDFLQRTPDSSDTGPLSPTAQSVGHSTHVQPWTDVFSGLIVQYDVLCRLQAPTNMASCAAHECSQRRHHYHPDLPTASHSLLQLYHQNVPEDLGPKAVRTTILLGGREHLSRLSTTFQSQWQLPVLERWGLLFSLNRQWFPVFTGKFCPLFPFKKKAIEASFPRIIKS